ncbi:MAG: cbb3-type cytochrome c oxidase subunit I [Pseudomonadota bacterium]
MSELSAARDYDLAMPVDQRQVMVVRWLWLSVLALLWAGVFSVLLVLARTPYIGEIVPFTDFFHTALVIHVDLSVLVWIMAFAGVLWSLVARAGRIAVHQVTFYLVAIATFTITISGFVPDARPIMSNYIPVLDNPLFKTGLALFCLGIGAQVLTAMSITPPLGRVIDRAGVIRFGLNCAAISVLVTLMAFIWSWAAVPEQLTGSVYYEYLFWGGGHLLQFTYVLLMMVCWVWLVDVAGLKLIVSERVIVLLFCVGLLAVFLAPLIYYSYPVTSVEHRELFTWLMSFGGSLSTFPLGLAIYIGLVSNRPGDERTRCAHSALMTSLLLFGIGGLIGFLIQGSDVTIPAHYHGCIVGVTLALMGTAYEILARLGAAPLNFRWANIQLWVYGSGQLLHITGLVWSGGYGVQRKVAGAEQGLDSLERIAGMGLMGFGGLLSAIGGFLFVIIAIRVLMARRHPHAAAQSNH